MVKVSRYESGIRRRSWLSPADDKYPPHHKQTNYKIDEGITIIIIKPSRTRESNNATVPTYLRIVAANSVELERISNLRGLTKIDTRMAPFSTECYSTCGFPGSGAVGKAFAQIAAFPSQLYEHGTPRNVMTTGLTALIQPASLKIPQEPSSSNICARLAS